MDNPLLKRFFEFIKSPSHSRTLTALVILIIAAAIPLTVLVAQQQQQTRQSAAISCKTNADCASCGGYCSGSTYVAGVGYTGGTCAGCTVTTTPPACNFPNTICSGTCTNVSTDPKNCGSCGNTCTGTTPNCISGTCSSTAPAGQPCGTTGVTCTLPQICINGACGTPTPKPTASSVPTSLTCSNGVKYPNTCSNTEIFCCNKLVGFGAICTTNASDCSAITTPPSPSTSVSPSPSPKATPVGTPYPSTCPTVPSGNGPAQTCTSSTGFTQCLNGTAQKYSCPSGYYCQNHPSTTNISCIMGCAERGYTCQTNCATGTQQASTYYCSSGVCCGPTPSPSTSASPSTSPGTSSSPGASTSPGTSASPGTQIACSSLTANPSSVLVGNTSALTANCTNTTSATTYAWTQSCNGSFANGNTSVNTNTWTAPNTSATCTVTVNACNGSTCSQTSTNITVNSNLCNAGPAINCGACQPALAACGAGNGRQTCQYSTYNGSTNCVPSGNPSNTCDLAVCTSASPSPSGTASPSPSPSAAPGDTVLALNVGMDGVGNVGDSKNATPLSNWQELTVAHQQRTVALQLWDVNNNEVITDQPAQVNYNTTSGIFTGSINLGSSLTSGNYVLKIKSDGHLRKASLGLVNIVAGSKDKAFPQLNLVAGDIDGNNIIDIRDYNIFTSCSVFSSSGVDLSPNAVFDGGTLCNSNSTYQTLSDLNDDGVIDQIDYNLFVREYSVQNGD